MGYALITCWRLPEQVWVVDIDMDIPFGRHARFLQPFRVVSVRDQLVGYRANSLRCDPDNTLSRAGNAKQFFGDGDLPASDSALEGLLVVSSLLGIDYSGHT